MSEDIIIEVAPEVWFYDYVEKHSGKGKTYDDTTFRVTKLMKKALEMVADNHRTDVSDITTLAQYYALRYLPNVYEIDLSEASNAHMENIDEFLRSGKDMNMHQPQFNITRSRLEYHVSTHVPPATNEYRRKMTEFLGVERQSEALRVACYFALARYQQGWVEERDQLQMLTDNALNTIEDMAQDYA